MAKKTEYQAEYDKWTKLFEATDPDTQQAASGLIQKAAQLHALCCELQETIDRSGAIKVHPENPNLQKPVPAVKEFARIAESYAMIVNKLNALRIRNTEDDEDDLDEFE